MSFLNLHNFILNLSKVFPLCSFHYLFNEEVKINHLNDLKNYNLKNGFTYLQPISYDLKYNDLVNLYFQKYLPIQS